MVSRNVLRAAIAALSLVALVPLVAGCGGGSASPSRATGVAIKIRWPETTRLVPAATRSLQVVIRDAANFETFRVANRPEGGGFSTLVFFGLTPGSLDFSARAFAAEDAQGVAVASAQSRVTLAAGVQTDVTLNLASTISRIDVTPAENELLPGQTVALTAAARNAAGDIVPVTASRTTWTSRDTQVATVDANGVVTAGVPGSTQIVFKDTESGQTNSALVVVNPAP